MSKFAKKKNPLVVDLDAKGGPKFVKGTGMPLEDKEPKESKKAKKAEKSVKKEASDKEPKKAENQKIVVLNKDHGARSGSMTEAVINAILKAKNTDAVIGTEVEGDKGNREVTRADIRWAVNKGFIELA